MTIRQTATRTTLQATLQSLSLLTLLELTTHLPSQGRSSQFYHDAFDHLVTPLGRRILGPEEAHNLALWVVKSGLAPRVAVVGGVGGVGGGGGVGGEGGSGSGLWNSIGGLLSGGGGKSVVKRHVDMSMEIGFRSQPSSPSTSSTKPLHFSSPIGLAAGFDKHGTALPHLFDLGFAFVEIGSVTPLPQPGNPKPRSFRLVEDRGVINRFGFNSVGCVEVKRNLEGYWKSLGGGPVGGGPGGGAGTNDAEDGETDSDSSATMEASQSQEAMGDADDATETDSSNDNNSEAPSLAQSMGNSLLWGLGWAWNKIMTVPHRTGVLGVNLGKNKLSDDEIGDYTTGIKTLGPHASYLVINVSSPNTPGLRSLQASQPLTHLLTSALLARDAYAPHAPLFVKIAPDLTHEEMQDIAMVVLKTNIDGMIISNTTNARPDHLLSRFKHETGGLSGLPLKEQSTRCIRTMYQLTNGEVPIIGVGGVSSGRDAFEKLKAGASLVQIYSMMVYEGPGVVKRIGEELEEILVEEGYGSVREVVGRDCEEIWWRKREEDVRRKMREVREREVEEGRMVEVEERGEEEIVVVDS